MQSEPCYMHACSSEGSARLCIHCEFFSENKSGCAGLTKWLTKFKLCLF